MIEIQGRERIELIYEVKKKSEIEDIKKPSNPVKHADVSTLYIGMLNQMKQT